MSIIENVEGYDINPYSLAAYYVDIMFNDEKLSNATCFFTKIEKQLYLVTNWHVVSGRNADTLEVLDKRYCALPNKLKVYLPKKDEHNALYYNFDQFLEIALLDENLNKLWLEKEINGRMVDVALIPCKDITDLIYVPIEDAEEPFNENVRYLITSNIYILGFPFGSEFGLLPIWKKASVASEPTIDTEDMPYFFADTATREGMSGSPVIYYEMRPISIISEKENKFSRHYTKFIGIYSGRIGAFGESKNDAQLGRIWKSNVLKDIIEFSKIK